MTLMRSVKTTKTRDVDVVSAVLVAVVADLQTLMMMMTGTQTIPMRKTKKRKKSWSLTKRLTTMVKKMGVKVLVEIPALIESDGEEEMKDIHDLHTLRADTGPTTVHEGAGGVDDGILTVNPVRTTLVSSACLGARRLGTFRVHGGLM